MILLLGQGYIGSAIIEEMTKRGTKFVAPRGYESYNTYTALKSLIALSRATAVINSCAFIVRGAVDNNEENKADTILGNLIFPANLSNACETLGVPMFHISTGCLYNGTNNGNGFSETEQPHLSWRTRPDCGSYVAAKQIAEEVVGQNRNTWIFRLRLPFDEMNHPRNYITKLMTYPKIVDAFNSLSNRRDFAHAAIDCVEKRIPFGTYNATNEGAVWAKDIVSLIKQHNLTTKEFTWWNTEEFMKTCARTPKSNCVLSVEKLKAAGIHMPHVSEAVDRSISGWRNA